MLVFTLGSATAVVAAVRCGGDNGDHGSNGGTCNISCFESRAGGGGPPSDAVVRCVQT